MCKNFNFAAIEDMMGTPQERNVSEKENNVKQEEKRVGKKSDITCNKTFKMRKETIEKLEGYAFYEGMSLKDTLDKIITEYLEGKTISKKKSNID